MINLCIQHVDKLKNINAEKEMETSGDRALSLWRHHLHSPQLLDLDLTFTLTAHSNKENTVLHVGLQSWHQHCKTTRFKRAKCSLASKPTKNICFRCRAPAVKIKFMLS